jgi:hypothetical protein
MARVWTEFAGAISTWTIHHTRYNSGGINPILAESSFTVTANGTSYQVPVKNTPQLQIQSIIDLLNKITPPALQLRYQPHGGGRFCGCAHARVIVSVIGKLVINSRREG